MRVGVSGCGSDNGAMRIGDGDGGSGEACIGDGVGVWLDKW